MTTKEGQETLRPKCTECRHFKAAATGIPRHGRCMMSTVEHPSKAVNDLGIGHQFADLSREYGPCFMVGLLYEPKDERKAEQAKHPAWFDNSRWHISMYLMTLVSYLALFIAALIHRDVVWSLAYFIVVCIACIGLVDSCSREFGQMPRSVE